MKIVAKDCAVEDKLLTVSYGCDMVNVSFVNFAAIGPSVAKVRSSTYLLLLCGHCSSLVKVKVKVNSFPEP